jgi:O-antigen/teichoic acid export membrane protein
MTLSLRQLVRKMFHLGSGELLARLCSIATLLFLAHRFGVVIVGVYALALSVSQYARPIIDFGLHLIGARLLARYPQAATGVVRRVQGRRFLMAGLLLPCLLGYAAVTRLSLDFKIFLFVFAAFGTLHAFSLDWAAWGKEHLRLVGLARSIVPAAILVSVLLGRNSEHILRWLAGGNAAGNVLQGTIFWLWWQRHKTVEGEPFKVLAGIGESLAWRRTSVMGMATLCILAFNTIDTLMLGVMSHPQQVGLYSAAYRVMNQFLYTYYLLTQVLYPQLSRQDSEQRKRMLRPQILLALLGAGVLIAALVTVSRRPIMSILFGHEFLIACPLLVLLAWAIPLDFLTSFLSNAYIAWGMETRVLLSITLAAATNIVLNLFWIPLYGATAAAVNTLISYVVLLTSLAVAGRSAKELAPGTQPQPELVA